MKESDVQHIFIDGKVYAGSRASFGLVTGEELEDAECALSNALVRTDPEKITPPQDGVPV